MGKLIGLDKLGTLFEPILHLIGKKAERPSWNENDPASASYIEGRPFYKSTALQTLAVFSGDFQYEVDWEQPLTGYIVEPIGGFTIVPGQQYKVTYNGTAYDLTAYVEQAWGNVIIGNGAHVGEGNEDNGLPFAIGVYDEGYSEPYAISASNGMHSFSVETVTTNIQKIPSEYLPPLNYVSYAGNQHLTDKEMQIARDNIGAGTSSFEGSYNSLSDKPTIYTDVVRYGTNQGLSDAQKEQARVNIDASDVLCYEKNVTSLFISLPFREVFYEAPSGNIFSVRTNANGFGNWIGNKAAFYAASSSSPSAKVYLAKTDYLDPQSDEKFSSYWGNMSLYSDLYEDTGENFCAYIFNGINNKMYFYSGHESVANDTYPNYFVESSCMRTEFRQLDPKFVPYTVQHQPQSLSDAQQAQARANIGAAKAEPPYALIETITLEEGATEVVRTDLSLAKVNLYLTIPQAETTLSIGGSIDNGAGMIGEIWLGGAINADGVRYAHVHAESANGWAFVDNKAPSAAASAVGALQRSSTGIAGDTPINKIALYATSSGTFPAGTVIEVFGVSAAG